MKTRTNTTIPTVQPSTNRYATYSYDEMGSVISDGSYTFLYDAFGQPLSKIYDYQNDTLEHYIYTPGDERIGVKRGGWWIWSVRDEGGKVLRQYKSSASSSSTPSLWLEDFVWRDGLLLGSQRPVEMGGRRHFHLDHLGTPRLITADNGQRISSHDYYPFGDEKTSVWQEGPSAGGFDREEPMKFTGHERDFAGGMGGEDGHTVDYMHARYYSPTFGRFLSVDPEMESAYAEIPQSWNRYTYVMNNPVKYIDLTGREITCVTVKDDKGNDQQICSESVDVHGNEPKVSEVTPVLTARDFQQTDLSYLRDSVRNNVENLKYLTPDDFSFKNAPKVDFGQCIEDNSFSNVYTFAGHTANAALNIAVGTTGRVGIGGVLPHATTWQHKALSGFGGNASRAGRFAGRAAIALTVFEGFYDIGTIGRCGALAASQ